MTPTVRDILHPAELLIMLLLTVTVLEPTAIGDPRETSSPAPPAAYGSTLPAASIAPAASSGYDEVDLARSIGHIEECRDIHLLWIRIMEANPERYANQTRYLGDVDYHRRWVEKYDQVLWTLNEIRAQIEASQRQ